VCRAAAGWEGREQSRAHMLHVAPAQKADPLCQEICPCVLTTGGQQEQRNDTPALPLERLASTNDFL